LARFIIPFEQALQAKNLCPVYTPSGHTVPTGEIMRHLALLIAAAAALGAAHAQTTVPRLDDAGKRGEIARQMKAKSTAEFDTADANKDAKLSKDEVAQVSDYLAGNFEKHDKDKDGFLSWEEFVGHNRWPK
jgi:EF hand